MSKITFVAIAAISLSVLAVTFAMGSAAGGAVPFVVVGLLLTTPLLSSFASHFQARGKELGIQAKIERAVANEYEQIQHWTCGQVNHFLGSEGIAPPETILPTTLLPLIARFEARKKSAIKGKQDSDEKLRAKDLLGKENVPEDKLRLLLLSSRHIGWQILETQVLPAALEAALCLEILSRPHSQTTLSSLGSLKKKNFEERWFDRLFGPDDHFFVFHSQERTPLTFGELFEGEIPSPDRIRLKLFPAT